MLTGNPGANNAACAYFGTKVKDHDEMLLRDRLRAKGVPVLGPWIMVCASVCLRLGKSIAGTFLLIGAINGTQWIDPEVVALAGISEEELERYKNPQPSRAVAAALPSQPLVRRPQAPT